MFAVCVIGAAGAMAWLTRQAVDADFARRTAEAEAELEQRISLVLWRMDTELAPIIAEEVIRPPEAFRSSTAAIAPPPYVLLQFEARAKGIWESPQSPLKAPMLPQLEQLSKAVNLSQLLPQLPEMPLPTLKDVGDQRVAASAQQQAALENQTDAARLFFETNRGANAPPDDAQQQVAVQSPESPAKQSFKNSPAAKEADYQMRNRRYQSAAEQNLLSSQQRAATPDDEDPFGGSPRMVDVPERVGVSRPVWIGDRLLLARRVARGGTEVVQGSWIDWPKLKARLLGEVNDLLPEADLLPIDVNTEADPGRLLAGLPVRLTANESAASIAIGPTLWWALFFGWGAVLIATAAAAALLQGVMRLSERRAAFVSSVTHELRTPLTTFRMYAEMLARGMVPDASRRQEYFETLQRESERLTLLVENVLAYARLERGRIPQGQDRVTVADLLQRVRMRLEQRAAQAEMECIVELNKKTASQEFITDLAVVEQILFNLVDNAAKYARNAADRRIHVEANRNGRFVKFVVRDHGPGIGRKTAVRSQPFEKSAQESAETAPGVGLGLALCRRLARQLGGRLEVAPANGEGAEVTLLLPVGCANLFEKDN